MGQLSTFAILCLASMLFLHGTSAGKKGTSSKKPTYTKTSSSSSSSSSNKPNQGSKTQASYPGQPNSYPNQHHPGGRGVNPGGYPSTGGSYTNWNPDNKILSPRYGGGFGGPGYGIGGSPFSKSVQSMGYNPSVNSKKYAKKAMVAAGVGAMTGMAVGYGLGRFPRPDFQFNSRQEEHYYNHYMHQRYSKKSPTKKATDSDVYERKHDYTFETPHQAQTYEKYMDKCMNRTDLLQNRDAEINSIQRDDPMTGSRAVSNDTAQRVGMTENATSEVTVPAESQESNDDTVSITEIGYPALIQQMEARKCVQLYIAYSESFPQKQTQEGPSSRSDPNGHSGRLVLLTTAIMALCGTLLLE